MYESYFGLHTEPFSVAPDPRFMYLSDVHREALKHLEIGLRGGAGFVLLTGEIGAGKTTVWRSFLEQLPPNFDVATVVNPKLGVEALLARVCEDLRVELPEGPVRDPIDALHGHLLLVHAQGRRTLIAVDEAQALSDEVLEQLRLLTNLVTSDRKLVQVLLIGQPELLDMLARPALEPVAQRVVARYHLPALPADETRRYVAHRLAVAGAGGPLPFDDAALARIHELCGGVPRRINVLCDRALLAAFEARASRVNPALVDKAATAVFARPVRAKAAPAAQVPPPPPAASRPLPLWAIAGGALALGLMLSPWLRSWLAGPQAAPVVAAVAPAPAPDLPAAPTPPPTTSAVAVDDLVIGGVDEGTAWRDLAAVFGATLGPGDACALAPAQGLQCYRGRGGLAPIRQLDRPALLMLADAAGRSAPVVLVGLGGQTATLRIAGRDRVVPLAVLARDWRGDFATFWRAPPGFRAGQTVVTAEDGALARWVGDRLNAADGGSTRPLGERVFAFQLAQGLAPDGLAGPQTLMQLNRAAGVDEPRLLRP
jgi:general secretion pathway protein A